MPVKTEIAKPVEHRALAKRSRLPAEGKTRGTTLSLLDISLDGVRGPRLIRQGGRLRVVASLDGNGIRGGRRVVGSSARTGITAPLGRA